MSHNMTGLTNFIRDIRNCQSKEDEEKRVDKELHNIRTNFMGSMDSYNAKKYVCKLLYIYMLGYDFDFGHMEAVNLISGSKYSEKQIGYLACAVLLDENSELVRLIINTIRNDLIGRNEVFTCLALAAMANIGGKEMAEALAPNVQKLLVSSTTRPIVKKKAALCLLRLYRVYPDILPSGEWTDRVLNLLEHQNIGVLTAVMSLVLALVAADPEEYEGAVRKVVWLLNQIVIKPDFPKDYVYWNVNCPWLQVKLLRLLQYYPPPDDRNMLRRLSQVLQTILNTPEFKSKSGVPSNTNNVINAVLFEAIDVIIHMDCEPELIIQAAGLLGRFLNERQTNVRYLGLEKMAHLAVANVDCLDLIRQHTDTIIAALSDADISIRRRALDLLYSMCDSKDRSEEIVRVMLDHFPESDHAMRDELALKIAILAEKFAPDLEWYVDNILELIDVGGDHVGEDVWYRVVQIVTNNEDLHEYAASRALKTLRSSHVHDIAVKVCGYILGEFGHVLTDNAGSERISAEEMFRVLHAHFYTSDKETQALLLTTYIKFVNVYAELKASVRQVLHDHEQAIDAEIQQRACEYLVLVLRDEELMHTLWDVMPAFPERESAVMLNAAKKEAAGNADAGPERAVDELEDLDIDDLSSDSEETFTQAQAAPAASAPPPAAAAGGGGGGGGSLLDLGVGGGVAAATAVAQKAKGSIDDLLGLGAGPAAGAGDVINDATTVERYNKLCGGTQGVFWDDATLLLQIGMKLEFHNNLARLALFYGNKATTQLAPVNAACAPGAHMSLAFQPLASVGPSAQAVQLVNVECKDTFTESPVVTLTLGSRVVKLRMPLIPRQFMAPYQLQGPDFIKLWNQVGGGEKEVQAVITAREGDAVTVDASKAVMTALKMAVLEGVDPKPENSVGVAMWCSTNSKHPVILRFETNAQARMYRCTVRSTWDFIRNDVLEFAISSLGTRYS